MAQNVALGFDNGFTDATHLQVVPDSTNPDIRIMLNIRSYGIWAESLMSPMNFFVEADLKLVYTPEMKTVYSTGVSIMREVSSVLSSVAEANVEVSVEVTGNARPNYNAVAAAHDAARLGAGVANLTAFFKMSDEEVTSAFYYMAVDAGSFIRSIRLRDALCRWHTRFFGVAYWLLPIRRPASAISLFAQYASATRYAVGIRAFFVP